MRKSHDSEVGRWLAECFLALGLGFVTLAVPLALDAEAHCAADRLSTAYRRHLRQIGIRFGVIA